MAPTSFGELLRSYRLAAGLTQEDLSERAGVSARGLSELERGARRKPHPASFGRLADALKLNEKDRAVLDAARSTTQPAEHALGQNTEFAFTFDELRRARA